MRFQALLLAFASVIFLEASASGAQVYDLGSVSGSIDGYAYFTTYPNGVAHTTGGSYSQQLDPSNGYSVSASATYSASSTTSLSAAASESALSFTAYSSAQTSSFAGASSQLVSSSLSLTIGFTITEAAQVQLTYDYLGSSGPGIYAFLSRFDSGMSASLVQVLDGGGTTSLYSLTADNYALETSQGFDTYGADDGVYFQTTLLPGNYQFSLSGYGTQGSSMANGSLNFQPVPEPGGMLLVVLGMAVLGRRPRR